MSNFNWNNYIGEHMNEPLRVIFSFVDDDKQIGILTGLNMDYLILSAGSLEDIQQYSKLCKPIIKSISDLTDEELLFVLGYDNSACRVERFYGNSVTKEYSVFVYYNSVCLDNRYSPTVGFSRCDQQLLNRLYSLHCHLNAEELIKNGKAVRKV